MSRDLTTTLTNVLDDDVVQPFFAVELLFDSAPIRLWTGMGDATIDGNTYIGTGNLLDISAVEETSEIAVRGATITLTGMNSEVISLALQSPYQGRVCNLYFGAFSPSRGLFIPLNSDSLITSNGNTFAVRDLPLFVPLGSDSFITLGGDRLKVTPEKNSYSSLTELFSGYMDEMNIEEGPEFGTIELKVENKLIDLKRARVRRFSSGYQKSVYPNDKGLDFVEDLQDKEIVWGRKVE